MKKEMKVEKEYFILLIIGFFVTITLLYLRFCERFPRNILAESYETLCIYFCITLSFLILFVITIYQHKTKYEKKKNVFQRIMLHPYNPLTFIGQSMITFDIFIKNSIPMYDHHVNYFDAVLTTSSEWFHKHKNYTLPLLYIIKTLVEFSILLMFFMDVFYLHKFYYFYKVLWLLIIPIMISYYFYSLKLMIQANIESLDEILVLNVIYFDDTSKRSILNITDWLTLCKSDMKDQIGCFHSLSQTFEETILPEDREPTLKYCVNFLDTAFNLNNFTEDWDNICSKYTFLFNISKYGLYLIGWSYVLIYNLT